MNPKNIPKPNDDIRDPMKEKPEEQMELTPEQQTDEELMQEFLDQDEDIEEITFGL